MQASAAVIGADDGDGRGAGDAEDAEVEADAEREEVEEDTEWEEVEEDAEEEDVASEGVTSMPESCVAVAVLMVAELWVIRSACRASYSSSCSAVMGPLSSFFCEGGAFSGSCVLSFAFLSFLFFFFALFALFASIASCLAMRWRLRREMTYCERRIKEMTISEITT